MPSLHAVLAAATLLLSSVQAQDQYNIDPSSVSLSLRDYWCTQQKSSCPLICQQLPPGGYETNDCDPLALTYGCVCENGMAPNLSEYSLTIPYFKCQEWGNQCVTNCGASNNACASDCRENHPCGALDPTRANTTTTSSMGTPTSTSAAATSSAGQLFNGLGGDDGSDSGSGSSGSTPKHNGASTVTHYGSIVGAFSLAACVCLGSLLL
ncbi:hypothetical protein HD806DRAFT_493064 [Xylariaceae sp. AK1471]|nr:hypothetical protein HD806DRAFT_493064 [Xylariaceae sp. AK1471]